MKQSIKKREMNGSRIERLLRREERREERAQERSWMKLSQHRVDSEPNQKMGRRKQRKFETETRAE